MDLLKPRSHPSFGRFEAVILGLYVLLSGWITYFHEPWADEAQAWLIARDSSLSDLFLKRLHYEGTPGLWHLLLWVFCRLHISYTGMHWATVVIGAAAVYLLLRYSPFPPLVRAVLPFCFSLVYLTAIVARSYSLAPVLTFAACAVLTAKRDRPVLFAVVLGLLGNTASFGFMLALGMAPLYFLRPGCGVASITTGRRVLAGSALALLLLFSAYTALPAPDMTFGAGEKLASHPAIGHLLSEVTGIPQPGLSKEGSLPLVGKLAPDLDQAFPDLDQAFLARHANHRFLAHQILRFVSIGSPAFFPVSKSNVLAFLFYAALLWWLFRRRSLPALLPLLMILLAGHYLGMGEHHMSLITAALIVALWVGWNRPASISRRSEIIFQVILLAVLVEQVAWTAHAAAYDIQEPFDGSIATAHFILPKVGKYRIASIGFEPLAVLPYTSHNIYYNQTTTYWPWKRFLNPDDDLAQVVAGHPDFILDGEARTADTMMADQIMTQVPRDWPYDPHDRAGYLREHGYRETHRFCGFQPVQFSFYRETCDLIYEPIR